MSDASETAGPPSESTDDEQRPAHLFAPGQSGNPAGRPKGSRNKLGEQFVEALQADFEQHGRQAIETVRVEKPDAYLKVIASLLPKEIKIEAVNDLSDDELDRRIKQLAAALSLEIGTGVVAGGNEAPEEPHPAVGIPTIQ